MHVRLLLPLTLVSALVSLLSTSVQPPEPLAPPPVATFSIVAFDAETGDLGVAVHSRFFGVGAVVPWARADVGAIATQAFANTSYGPEGLGLLDDGRGAEAVRTHLTDADPQRDRRQLGVVDARGGAAAFTGAQCVPWAGHHVGEGFACQGNILAGEAVVEAMAATYEASTGPLAERLVAALAVGQKAGGDKRGRQSAALLVVRRGGGYAGFDDRYIDLHVEDHPRPIEELARLLALRRRSLPAARVPTPLPEGLVREPREADPPRTTPRSAFEAAVRRGTARGTYLGTRMTDTGAEVHVFVPGRRAAMVVAMRRGDTGVWTVAE